jgi:hypothetical protein
MLKFSQLHPPTALPRELNVYEVEWVTGDLDVVVKTDIHVPE